MSIEGTRILAKENDVHTTPPARAPGGVPLRVVGWAIVFAALALLEVLWYPELAAGIRSLTGRSSAEDSPMGYFVNFRVMPAAIAFVAVSAISLQLAARRTRRMTPIILALLCLNAALVIGSALWYFREITPPGNGL